MNRELIIKRAIFKFKNITSSIHQYDTNNIFVFDILANIDDPWIKVVLKTSDDPTMEFEMYIHKYELSLSDSEYEELYTKHVNTDELKNNLLFGLII